jgi:hypothetical protein
MKFSTTYFFVACCYFLVLLEIPCLFFGQHVTYFVISPVNCQGTFDGRDPSNLYLTLYAGACTNEYSSISFINIFQPDTLNGCIDPQSKNWTAIDLENKKYGQSTELQRGGQDIRIAYYTSVTGFLINILICVAIFGLQFKQWAKLTCCILVFLMLAAFTLSISSFYIISHTDQVLSTSWSTYYFRHCDVNITKGLAYTLNLVIITISGTIIMIPFLISLLFWIAPHWTWSMPVVQPNNTVVSELDLWEIFPDAGRCSLDIVNVYRNENSPNNWPTQRHRATPLRATSQETVRPYHQAVVNLVETSIQTEAETLNDASFSKIFDDDYRTIKTVIGDKDTGFIIEQPLHTINNSGMKENQYLIRRNNFGEVSILISDGISSSSSPHSAIQSFQNGSNADFASSYYFESFSDTAFSRSAHIVGLLKPPGGIYGNNHHYHHHSYGNSARNTTGTEYPVMHFNDLFPVDDDWIFDNYT